MGLLTRVETGRLFFGSIDKGNKVHKINRKKPSPEHLALPESEIIGDSKIPTVWDPSSNSYTPPKYFNLWAKSRLLKRVPGTDVLMSVDHPGAKTMRYTGQSRPAASAKKIATS